MRNAAPRLAKKRGRGTARQRSIHRLGRRCQPHLRESRRFGLEFRLRLRRRDGAAVRVRWGVAGSALEVEANGCADRPDDQIPHIEEGLALRGSARDSDELVADICAFVFIRRISRHKGNHNRDRVMGAGKKNAYEVNPETNS